jgi:hypothetical protein
VWTPGTIGRRPQRGDPPCKSGTARGNRREKSDERLYSSKIVDKKEILRTVSNTGIYCSSDKVGTVKNSTVNINALCNSCEDMACCSSVQCTVDCTVKQLYLGNCSG